MYYSDRGVSFDRQYRACARQDRLEEIQQTNDMLQMQVKPETAPFEGKVGIWERQASRQMVQMC
jgi:hypothetical protein